MRIITPDQPELIPLNLLTLKDFSWAGKAIVQIGRRLWEEYWGPRMQAALLGLCRVAHAWNMSHPDAPMGYCTQSLPLSIRIGGATVKLIPFCIGQVGCVGLSAHTFSL